MHTCNEISVLQHVKDHIKESIKHFPLKLGQAVWCVTGFIGCQAEFNLTLVWTVLLQCLVECWNSVWLLNFAYKNIVFLYFNTVIIYITVFTSLQFHVHIQPVTSETREYWVFYSSLSSEEMCLDIMYCINISSARLYLCFITCKDNVEESHRLQWFV